MHKVIALAAVVAGATLAFSVAPSTAAPRLANPSDASTLVVHVNGKPAVRRARMARGYDGAYWHYRLEAGREMHYQVVNAGYPARRYEGEVVYRYLPGDACCGYRRHWPWMGHYHHGHRYWPWHGRHHRHHAH
jgi:hypothetical protein